MVQVLAVIVNHNTSLFSELALRSLMASHATDRGIDLSVTIVDNHSTDPDLPRLERTCVELGAELRQSRWPLADAAVNTHGDVLRDLVLDQGAAADSFLFVDCDIDFEEPASVSRMSDDLASDEQLWAVQARFRWTETNDGPGSSLDIWGGKPIDLRVGRDVERWEDCAAFAGTIQDRCHPGATLVRNSVLFRRVAEVIGFSCAVRMSQDESHAGFFDTFGLASAAMDAAGYRYDLSRVTVHHFFMASYDDQHVEARRTDCVRRLDRFA